MNNPEKIINKNTFKYQG